MHTYMQAYKHLKDILEERLCKPDKTKLKVEVSQIIISYITIIQYKFSPITVFIATTIL